MQKFIANTLLSARWLLAPIYLGLSLALLMIAIKFFIQVIHVIPDLLSMSETDLVLVVLALIDMALVGSLVVMVMLSGYENFITRFEKDDNLGWLSQLDASSLKIKVATSIVAISAIHLLQIFMNAESVPNDKIMWYMLLHLTFVITAFVLSMMDNYGKKES